MMSTRKATYQSPCVGNYSDPARSLFVGNPKCRVAAETRKSYHGGSTGEEFFLVPWASKLSSIHHGTPKQLDHYAEVVKEYNAV